MSPKYNHICLVERGSEKFDPEKRGEGDVTTEAKIGMVATSQGKLVAIRS